MLLYKSQFRHIAGKVLPKWEDRYNIKDVYRSGAIKINDAIVTRPWVVNGQRLKQYIAGNPHVVDTDII